MQLLSFVHIEPNSISKMKYIKYKFFYKLFVRHLNFLLIVPESYETNRFLQYVKVVFVASTITVSFCWEMYFRSNRLRAQPDSEKWRFLYSKGLLETLGFLNTIFTLVAYLKKDHWQNFYKHLDLKIFEKHWAQKDESIEYNSKIAFCILAFALRSALFVYTIVFKHDFGILGHLKLNVVEISFISVSVYVRTYYLFSVLTFILVILLEIQMQIKKARKLLTRHPDLIFIKRAQHRFNEMQKASGLFSMLYAYNFLILFAQWMIFLVNLFTRCYTIIKGDRVDFVIILEFLWRFLSCSFGQIAVTLVSDMVTTEADKLLNTCYKLQNKFDHQSYQYQELQSLVSHIANTGIRFTAADFFEIKLSTLLSAFLTSTTYFVALVQFYQI